jgi:acyl dehydratase
MTLATLYLRALLGARTTALREASERTTVDGHRLSRYREVCGFPSGSGVPATFPHLLAFPLTLRIMTSKAFPAPVLGLVHLRNSITQYRPIEVGEPLTVRAWLGETADHDRGTTIELLAEAISGDTPIWYEQSIYLHRHRKPSSGSQHNGSVEGAGELWPVPAGTGRRYASVSGDRNPIHLSAVTARLFGFRTAIAHGMWAKARCVAALADLPDTYRVDVTFRRPVPVPGRVAFHREGNSFTLTGPDGTPTHLTGAIEVTT